ncbi:MAG: FAD:protein FMN transferase, partial [Lachnobacterium sp.]|nr:FAD:protein FMN transferase [Lachnobacterium sp.]
MEPLRFKIKKHRNNFTNRMIGIVLLIALLCSLLSGCSSETKKVSKEGFYFDTIITITLYGTDDEKYINDCFSLAKEYENKFSNTIKDSEISQINDADGNFVTVSDDTLELIQDGINYGKESDGKFDIAIGTLSDLWNISEIAENTDSSNNEVDTSVLPSNDDIRNALAHIDYRSIEIKGNQVRLSDPDAKLDLGGIAKGYIADQMRSYLRDQGITEGVISLGGNVLTLGEKASGDNYAIGIQKPFA